MRIKTLLLLSVTIFAISLAVYSGLDFQVWYFSAIVGIAFSFVRHPAQRISRYHSVSSVVALLIPVMYVAILSVDYIWYLTSEGYVDKHFHLEPFQRWFLASCLAFIQGGFFTGLFLCWLPSTKLSVFATYSSMRKTLVKLLNSVISNKAWITIFALLYLTHHLKIFEFIDPFLSEQKGRDLWIAILLFWVGPFLCGLRFDNPKAYLFFSAIGLIGIYSRTAYYVFLDWSGLACGDDIIGFFFIFLTLVSFYFCTQFNYFAGVVCMRIYNKLVNADTTNEK